MADGKKKSKWIAGATANSHGQLRRKAEAAGESTAQFAREHADSPGLLGKQSRLAETLMGLHGGRHKPRVTKPSKSLFGGG